MKLVKQFRKELKIKQQEMAKRLNIEQGNYCNMENGRLVPKGIEDVEQRALTELAFVCENRLLEIAQKKESIELLRNQIICKIN